MDVRETLVRRLLYSGFWEGKVPCWEMLRCPRSIRDLCPASRHQELPCWEMEGTYAKLTRVNGMVTGCDTEVCTVCRVHKRWGNQQPAVIRLFGEGINNRPGALDRLDDDPQC